MSKTRIKRSPIWKINVAEFKNLVERAHSISEIIKSLNVPISSGSFAALKLRAIQENISIVHLKEKVREARRNCGLMNVIPLEEILVENSTYCNISTLKSRLVRAGLLQEKCYACGDPPVWKGKPLKLQLDHINGVKFDHRIENLRLICPNCHSQTSTYAGRNIG